MSGWNVKQSPGTVLLEEDGGDIYEWPSRFEGPFFVDYYCKGDCACNATIPLAALEEFVKTIQGAR